MGAQLVDEDSLSHVMLKYKCSTMYQNLFFYSRNMNKSLMQILQLSIEHVSAIV